MKVGINISERRMVCEFSSSLLVLSLDSDIFLVRAAKLRSSACLASGLLEIVRSYNGFET